MYLFFFNDPATTEIYTLSLHDALPISDVLARAPLQEALWPPLRPGRGVVAPPLGDPRPAVRAVRSEEHTSELQSLAYLVCRLLLEKKNHFFNNQFLTAHYPNYSSTALL